MAFWDKTKYLLQKNNKINKQKTHKKHEWDFKATANYSEGIQHAKQTSLIEVTTVNLFIIWINFPSYLWAHSQKAICILLITHQLLGWRGVIFEVSNGRCYLCIPYPSKLKIDNICISRILLDCWEITMI